MNSLIKKMVSHSLDVIKTKVYLKLYMILQSDPTIKLFKEIKTWTLKLLYWMLTI